MKHCFLGEISDSYQDHAETSKAVVIYTEIDASGKPVIPPGTPMEIAKQLQRMQFDPPKRNGIAVRVKIPILLSIE